MEKKHQTKNLKQNKQTNKPEQIIIKQPTIKNKNTIDS